MKKLNANYEELLLRGAKLYKRERCIYNYYGDKINNVLTLVDEDGDEYICGDDIKYMGHKPFNIPYPLKRKIK